MQNVKLLKPKSGAVVSLATRRQAGFAEFVKNADPQLIPRWMEFEKRKGREDLSIPKPVRFEWDGGRAFLEISENADFSDAAIAEETESPAEIYNLKTGTKYYWRLSGGRARSFRTADTFVRMIRAAGASNIRDVGSLRTEDGRRLKMGLFFRGTELDDHHPLTPEGRRALHDTLGIRVELDLRAEKPEGDVSPIGDDVRYVNMPCKTYHVFLDEKDECRALLEFLADENNYPMYVHCQAGADRTGTLSYVLETILGVSDEDRLADYEITSLSVWGYRRRSTPCWGWGWFMENLDKYNGSTCGERIMDFVYSCGVTDETLDKIRKIFTV